MPAPNRLLHPFQFLNSWRFHHQPPRHCVAMTGRKLTKRQQQDFTERSTSFSRTALPFANDFSCAATLDHGGTIVPFHSLHYMYRRSMLPSTNLHKGNSLSDTRFQVLFTCTPLKMMTFLLQVHTLARRTLLARDARVRRVTWWRHAIFECAVDALHNTPQPP